jgi:hypothetical protein
MTIGEQVRYGPIFAGDVMEGKQARAFTREEYIYKIASLATDDPTLIESPDSVCGFPMEGSEGLLGVMELSCKCKILPEDLKLLDCFSTFAAISVENAELQDIVDRGKVEGRIKAKMTKEERVGHRIPEKFQIPDSDERKATLFTNAFDSSAWNEHGAFQVLWAVMDAFGLLEEFKIPNEKWFRFMTAISETYKKVPYHNWKHAVDVTEFLVYELKATRFDAVLTKFELFAFIIAAICHDANHDGFTNTYNEKAETPLGILFKNQSVMETHHCAVAISVISKEECNIFSGFDSTEYRKMWTLIIQLILITDMGKHFGFVNELNQLMDSRKLNWDVPEDRLKAMQCLLKCADISSVARPFELADKWCDVLCEEFFRQGDLESAAGMQYTNPLNDRAHLDKPNSQIGFYTYVCLPLFETGGRMFPDLQLNVSQVKANLQVWKSACK